MISFIQGLPAWLLATAFAHPFLTTVIVLILCALGYIGLLKVALSVEDARDLRQRGRDRNR